MKFNFKKVKNRYFTYAVSKVLILATAVVAISIIYNKYLVLDKYTYVFSEELVNSVGYENFTKNIELKEYLTDERLFEKRDSFVDLITNSKSQIVNVVGEDELSDIYFYENLNALLNDYDILSKQSTLLFKYIINIGDVHNGLYGKMKKSEQNFLSKIKYYDTKGEVAHQFELLNYSMELLLENKSVVILGDMKRQINKISDLVENKIVFPNNYVKVSIKDQFLYFKASFFDLVKQVSSVGFGNKLGLMAEISLNYNRVNKRLEKLLYIIKSKKALLRKYVLFSIITLLLASISLSFFAFRFLEKSVRTVFEEIKRYIKMITKGYLPKINKNQFIEEAYPLIELFEEYEKQITTSKNVLRKFIDDKKFKGEQYFDKTPVFKSEFSEIQKKILTLQEQLRNEIDKSENIFWVNKGINKITDILRSKYDNSVLHSEELITNLVKFLDVPIGALYAIDNKVIIMKASFAYGEVKRFQRQLMFGEGVVGTAAAERRTIQLNEIPKDYFQIISGFGHSKPKSILISPIKLNDNVYGVIELASFSKFKEREIKFVQEVSKTIAYSFAISNISNENFIKIDNMQLEIAQLKAEKSTLINDYNELDLDYRKLSDNLKENKLVIQNIDDAYMIANMDIDGSLFSYNKNFDKFFKALGINKFSFNVKQYFSEINDSSNFDIKLIWKNLRLGVKYPIIHDVKIFDEKFSFYTMFIPISNEKGKYDEVKMLILNLSDGQ